MRLAYAGCSERGLVRSANEDAYLMRAGGDAALFLVADGIGGRAHGAVVSGMLRDGYSEWCDRRMSSAGEKLNFQTAMTELKEVLFEQNRRVVSRFGEMAAGSTLVLLFLLGDRYLYLSSGDSRIYRSRGLSFRQITNDDVCAGEQGAAGKLVGAVGIRPVPEYTAGTGELRRGDRFFLCSDGVYRYFSLRQLCAKVRFARDPSSLVKNISRGVELGGAGDNYSMIFVRAKSV